MTLEITEKEKEIIDSYRILEELSGGKTNWVICDPDSMYHSHFIKKSHIKDKLKQLELDNNNFRDMVFNVPTKVERDFIAYMTLKELLED